MGNVIEDSQHDEKYYTQSDESVESLKIGQLVLITNKSEENRVKKLLNETVEGNAIIRFEWYIVYHFFKTGYKAKFEYIETDNFNTFNDIGKKYDGKNNLCILEIKDYDSVNQEQLQSLWSSVGIMSVMINKDIPCKFRFNYLYK